MSWAYQPLLPGASEATSAAPTGYTHKVNTVAPAAIAKVETVATANIAKVQGA